MCISFSNRVITSVIIFVYSHNIFLSSSILSTRNTNKTSLINPTFLLSQLAYSVGHTKTNKAREGYMAYIKAAGEQT